MDQTRFTQLMEVRGCTHQERSYCGTYQGWPFMAVYMRGGANSTVFSLRVLFDKKVPGAFFKQVRAGVKGLASLQRLNGGNASIYFVTATVKDDANLERAFDTLVQAVAQNAVQLGLGLPQNCPVCKKPGCDSYAFAGAYQPVHAACVMEKSATQQIKVQQNEVSGSYGLGVLGAVLGGVVGGIPTILTVALANTIIGWLCALIPLGAYLGYKLLRGKLTRAALVIVIAVSVLLAPVLHYLSVAFMFMKEGAGFIGVDLYLALFEVPKLGMLGDLGLFFLFTGFGILVVSGIISRNNKHAWNEAAFAAATLRPMAAAGAPAPAYSPLPQAQPAAAPAAAPGIDMSDAPPPAIPGELS